MNLTMLTFLFRLRSTCFALLLSTILRRSDGILVTFLSSNDMVDKKLDESIGQFCSVTGASYVQTRSDDRH
jgi:hypothetical protein